MKSDEQYYIYDPLMQMRDNLLKSPNPEQALIADLEI